MATVTFDHVTKKYGEVTAVDDFNLEIQDGEFMVFVGPSGCGKTTSLRMIAGLEDITIGNLSIGDKVVNDMRRGSRHRDGLPELCALPPHERLRQPRLRPHAPQGRQEGDRRRVKEAAETIPVTTLLTRKPKELSGGQRQRVALGRAIVRERPSSSWTSRSPTSTPSWRVQTRAEIAASTSGSRRRSSTSPTIRSRR